MRLVCAAPGDGLAPALRPDVRVRMRPDRGPELCRVSAEGDPLDGIRIEVGTRADYDALARFHYRAGPPATFARVWRAIDVGTDALIGVLVVSRPTLNGAWRDLAWPGRYSSGSKRQRAARLNAELRTISRVIVEPRWRGCGAGRALVRSYLDEPLTPATEAVAAMGAACPFFARAGMVEHPRSVREPDARLLDALDHAGLEPWRLIDPLARAAAIRDPFLMRELRRWANSSGATRRYLHQSPDALTRAAARAIGARPRAYTHTRGM